MAETVIVVYNVQPLHSGPADVEPETKRNELTDPVLYNNLTELVVESDLYQLEMTEIPSEQLRQLISLSVAELHARDTSGHIPAEPANVACYKKEYE